MSEFLKKYTTSMADYTDAPAVFHTACAYSIFGTLLTRHKYRLKLQGGMPPRWTNLWMFIVGDSGDSRKTTAISYAWDILRRIDEEIDAPTEGSPEGFLMWMLKREKALTGNATGIIVATEMATLLAQYERAYASAMKPILMEIYDVPPVHKRELAKQSFTIPNPRISMLAGIATELLPSMAESDDWLGGFFSRSMLVYGERTRLLERSSTPPDSVLKGHADSLWRALRSYRSSHVGTHFPLLDYSKEALKTVRELPPPPDDSNLRLFLSRAPVHLMKCAAIEQVDEDPEATEIGRGAVERAMNLIMYWYRTAPGVLEECFARSQKDMQGDRLAKRVHRFLQRSTAREAPWTEVMRACALHATEIRKAIESLQEADLVEVYEKVEEESGKKSTWVRTNQERASTADHAKAFDTGVKQAGKVSGKATKKANKEG